MTIVYRHMEAADIPVMIELGAEMHEESAFRRLDYDRDICFDLGVRYHSDP